ncbi:Clathrin light chain [Coemansia biformis]|uniref:Clathrin light chain n=1 Tax=Coemansia biformis TaxID=1286918 RepID=A0A9W7Y7W6_9FUNG|nr:Clathrin light chain [Coemansia biformis]
MAAEDPMAEFLARERAALGDAAALFQSTDGEQPTPPIPSNAGSFSPSTAAAFSPANGSAVSEAFSPPASMAFSPPPPPPRATEFEQEWQAKHRESIAARDQAAETKHGEMVAEARQAIDRFYEEYNDKKDKAVEANRASQAVEAQAADRGALWERTVRQIDLATKGASAGSATPPPAAAGARDTTRMRDLLQDLRRDADAPGNKPKSKQQAAA